ncbi:MAG TPA: hypothetical protein VFK06_22245 [Candidatus Angelobacter sp.]|nr:hypothetical protein [Candidatus Angelobacter sp.]
MRKRKTVLCLIVIIVITMSAVGVFKYKAALRQQPMPPAPTIKLVQQIPKRESRPLLNTLALPPGARQHLLDGTFTLVTFSQSIAQGCRAVFDASFTPAISTDIELANPGNMFQSSDAFIQGAPFRRLVFAGQRTGRCFIYYQHGGTMYPRFCLAVMDDEHQGMLWAGETSKEGHTLEQLRIMLRQGDFMDKTGATC